jgi:hypothetical protein
MTSRPPAAAVTAAALAGFLDELRFSARLRYDAPFDRPRAPHVADAGTAALYHFDEGVGDRVLDASRHPDGPSDGVLHYGGDPPGPEWYAESPF